MLLYVEIVLRFPSVRGTMFYCVRNVGIIQQRVSKPGSVHCVGFIELPDRNSRRKKYSIVFISSRGAFKSPSRVIWFQVPSRRQKSAVVLCRRRFCLIKNFRSIKRTNCDSVVFIFFFIETRYSQNESNNAARNKTFSQKSLRISNSFFLITSEYRYILRDFYSYFY